MRVKNKKLTKVLKKMALKDTYRFSNATMASQGYSYTFSSKIGLSRKVTISKVHKSSHGNLYNV